MTTHVISFFADDTARASFENHRRYCARLAYPHEYVDTAAIGWAHLRMLLKYQVLLRKLRACAEGDLVLLITQDCLLLRDIPCETLMRGENRDWIVSYRDDDPGDVMAAFQLWRNTAAAREQVQRICEGARFGRALASEAQLLSALGPRPFTEAIEGHHPVVLAALNVSPIWAEWPAFSLALADMPDAPKNQPVFADLRDLFAEHINECQARGLPYLALPQPEADETRYEASNRSASIALAMLHTPNIREYGAIAERNVRRYCERHGYALHLYRDVPAEAGAGASGNWIKPWVLLRHLPEHEWVFWIDADVLVADQSRRLEPLCEKRDRVLATDVSWQFNSGIMGFRNTPQNLDVLTEIEQCIGAIADKSSTYASGGDQDVFIKVLARHGLADSRHLLDCATINTPYQLQSRDSFMVHYMHMWPSLRALIMHHGDLTSQMRGARRP
ncbi:MULTISPECIES: hypothetical protein [Caballeronia]|uniref:Galactosyl transferase GMA12/MNN10 domain protein n=1 Tax=Caballeronia zhejiangensis TaxID=871203 RepID=A0A656QLS3_9BURK|nr:MULTISPECIES: hypothetical protein [Caballeronia]EKS70451.1 hypothetical protein BURK_020305 [Burkholderia sp. SJ98]KDR29015.1 hypothetical protein BG60_08655 [Caballeronia zhejiangensis]MDR5790969.1 hypothetical protein [Caballeronia sp. LP003]